MLETPKSAKTPSTFRIPNSCAASAILENGDCTIVTFAPNLFSRSRANSNACASRSRLINLPEVSRSAIASECPPAPSVASMYVPSGLMHSHSSTSSNITGVCAALNLFSPSYCRPALVKTRKSKLVTSLHPYFITSSNPQRRVIGSRIRLILQLIQHPGVVHHLEIIQSPENVHFAHRLSGVAQDRRQKHSSLPIQFRVLSKIAGAQQELLLRYMCARQLRQLVFDFRPNFHRINSCRLACRTCDIKLVAVLLELVQKH